MIVLNHVVLSFCSNISVCSVTPYNSYLAEPEKPRMDNSSAKAWEKMALDDLLRISRDSRYLPSPTISMCTEDSTMEPREAMRLDAAIEFVPVC